ncbi:MAG: hypothetical protein ACRENG_23490 [bacterium]
MSQLINESKLAQLTGFLEKLQEFEKINYEEFEQDKHFAVERLLELLVIYASDILLNYFSQIKEDIPTTLRTTFLRERFQPICRNHFPEDESHSTRTSRTTTGRSITESYQILL